MQKRIALKLFQKRKKGIAANQGLSWLQKVWSVEGSKAEVGLSDPLIVCGILGGM